MSSSSAVLRTDASITKTEISLNVCLKPLLGLWYFILVSQSI